MLAMKNATDNATSEPNTRDEQTAPGAITQAEISAGVEAADETLRVSD